MNETQNTIVTEKKDQSTFDDVQVELQPKQPTLE